VNAEYRARGKGSREFELADTGVFDQNRYFDVFVEYAKAGPEDILIRISVANRGPEPADMHLLPTVWFRNTWSWGQDVERPSLRRCSSDPSVIEINEPELGRRWLLSEGSPSSPILDREMDPRFLNRPEILGVARYKRSVQPHGDGGNQAIGEFDHRALLPCRRLDGGRRKIVGVDRRKSPRSASAKPSLFSVGCKLLELKAINDLADGDAREGENAVVLGVTRRAAGDGGIVTLEVLGEDVGVQDRLDCHQKVGSRLLGLRLSS
jgi:hypothetical protein